MTSLRSLLVLLALAVGLAACASDGKSKGDTTSDSGDATDQSGDTVNPPTGGAGAPELDRIGNRRAPIDKQLVIEVSATDPEGDELTYSVFGDLPDGSKFAKLSRTFEWTPTAADDGRLIILTFAVSDGEHEDRETIQITVTTSDESTRPEMAEIGDVFVEVNEPFEYRLQATDEDGDALTFSTAGPLPSGAELDAKTGIVTWTPSASQQGTAFRVTFRATDGEFTAEADARFLVQTADLKIGPIDPQEVELNATLTLVLPIENPLDFKFTCASVGELSAGATFDAETCTLSYTPTDASLVGTSKEFTFRVTGSGNGVDYNLLRAATVLIVEAGSGNTMCADDEFEANDTESTGTAMMPGTWSGLTICGDEDWYTVDVGAGQTLTVTVDFEHRPNGDLDIAIFGPTGEDPVAVGDSASSNEVAILPDADAGTYSIVVFEFADGTNTYDLGIDVSGSGCPDDGREPNDTSATATSLGSGDQYIDDGRICPGNADYLSFDGMAGQQLNISLAFDNSVGDLDMELFDPQGTLLAWSRLAVDEENIDVAALPSSGTYTVHVYGYQNASADYLLEITQTTGVMCTPDMYETNDDPGSAAGLGGADVTVSNLTFCGDIDYYTVDLGAMDTMVIDLNWTGSGNTATMVLYDPNAIVSLASATPQTGGGGLTLEYAGDGTARTHILEVSNGTLGLDYELEIVHLSGSMCDTMSCPSTQVCGDNGMCVSDFCITDMDCPSAYRCRQTYCVDACFGDSECRQSDGYTCRGLDPMDSIAFCGDTGTSLTGESCFDFTDCGPERTCLTTTRFPGGYCAELGCASDADCDVDATCVDVDGVNMCLAFCFQASDCRMGDGYSCQSLPAAGGGNIDVCIQ